MSRAAADTIHGACVLCCAQDACLCLVDKKEISGSDDLPQW